ncbi:MAG: hypothetical protein HY896_09560 [Deltaproteobacteria bacterium]|nr:hypothetical protein [Deltaproteobacteria bacterium]
MDRMAGKIAAAAVILLLSVSLAFGENPKAAKPQRRPDGKNIHRLEEVRITGSAEHPGVLFFLPKARFRLLPVRYRRDGKENLLRECRGTEDFPE